MNNHCYVFNKYPKYTPPKLPINPPRIINAIRKSARNNSPSNHVLWRTEYRFHGITKKLIIEQRSINLHRRRSIDAISECLAAHFNLITYKVHMTLSQISNACGLTTYNKNGIPSYSRASRAITEHFEAIDAVTVERIWDNTTKSYIPNIIYITPIFFILINYDYGKILSARNQQLSWENIKLKSKGEQPISFTEAKNRSKRLHIKLALENRIKNIKQKKLLKEAKKLLFLEEQKMKIQIQKDIIRMYTKEELAEMGHIKFARIVNHRFYLLKKIKNNMNLLI